MPGSALHAVTGLLITLTVALGYSLHSQQQSSNLRTSVATMHGSR